MLLGEKQQSDTLHLTIALPYRDPAAVQAFVDSVSDPKSPAYRHFITPAQVGERFGLPSASVQSVASYLARNGMQVRLVADNHLSILADATVGQAETAFQTSIHEFLPLKPGALAGSIQYSLTAPPSLPAPIASSVSYIGGLESFTHPVPHGQLSAAQLRAVYSVAPGYGKGYRGAGRVVGISSFEGYRLSNVPLEYLGFGLPTPPRGIGSNISVKSIDGANGSAQESAEGDIDIECVLAMAPLCSLVVYDDSGGEDLLGTLTAEANDNLADVITESYGWDSTDPSFYAAAHNLHLSLSAQGITYMCASGDSGTLTLDPAFDNFTPYPDDDPEVLTVGGTTLLSDTEGDRVKETGWSQSGGGWVVSSDGFNMRPAYQKGNGVPTDIPYRLVPDVAFDADPDTGYEIYVKDQLAGWGGTSCASPTCAGALADAEEQIIAGGGLPTDANGKHRFGRIQDLLYSFDGNPSVFYNVTSGSNGALPNGNKSVAGPGWSTVTGWGPIVFSGLVTQTLNASGSIVISFSPASVAGGNTTSGTLALATAATSGGTVVELSSSSTLASVPASVTVPAGQKNASFQVETVTTASPVSVVVTAVTEGQTGRTTLMVDPPSVAELIVAPQLIQGGSVALGTVSLNGPAPTAGLTLNLSSNSASVDVPGSVRVPKGASSAQFKVDTRAVATTTVVTVTAKHGSTTASCTLEIQPPTVSSIAVTPSSAVGAKGLVQATVTLTGPAPAGGIVLALASSNPNAATLPAQVRVGSGGKELRVSVETKAVSAPTAVTFTASIGSTAASCTLTVLPPVLTALTASPAIVRGGSSTKVTGTVRIGSPAPLGGLTVTLTSSNPSAAAPPSTVTVPTGRLAATFPVTHLAVTTDTPLAITATSNGTSKQAKLTVTPQ